MIPSEAFSEINSFLLDNAIVSGKLWQSHTGHHRGDALMEVESVESQ
ncbi:DUF4431 domain-containing protein [Thiosocius teredinicola]